ncbi:Zn(II)2Cys6 transcription factor domain-containing protein [Aspergillus aculeatinus CBS 121060]|uniref:C6 transcription factor n=1 Tax=Aspergillus aculeatinus CBS 121060 TaxID=1448322 RepID=A0ACD1HBP2_9EURO|nr:putative C6 transcription factor [Aspergillus aculeatinus CBS 121060]RAH70998.1 putative C6 transcription factor [Aspergillus aculeatinus CBS 121060]
MTARQSSPTSDHSHSDGNVRKRVCKACDRCRLKKSKCDGANPCGRCRTDNAICVFGERKKAHDKVYPKGYVEMLEQQQAWLVHGLQELYRRATEGEGWPGEPLQCEPNGHPLTHDLLTRLGALDQTKGERFEENTEAMQQELWTQNAGHMQRQDSSDGSSDSAQSPTVPTRFSDPFAHQMPPTPTTFSASRAQGPTIKTEPQMAPSNPAFAASMSMQGVVNPLALQTPQQWPSNNFSSFEDIDLIGASDYTNLSFDDQVSSPMFNRQIPMSCMLTSSYMDTKSDYEDINQFLNANPPEVAST